MTAFVFQDASSRLFEYGSCDRELSEYGFAHMVERLIWKLVFILSYWFWGRLHVYASNNVIATGLGLYVLDYECERFCIYLIKINKSKCHHQMRHCSVWHSVKWLDQCITFPYQLGGWSLKLRSVEQLVFPKHVISFRRFIMHFVWMTVGRCINMLLLSQHMVGRNFHPHHRHPRRWINIFILTISLTIMLKVIGWVHLIWLNGVQVMVYLKLRTALETGYSRTNNI